MTPKSAPIAQSEFDVAQWRKSTYSGSDNGCVEVADGMGAVLPVRDSKDISRSPLLFSPASWSAFIDAVKENARL